jgi:adenine-specific DNA-methyltransferase
MFTGSKAHRSRGGTKSDSAHGMDSVFAWRQEFSAGEVSHNKIIHGDNKLALEALSSEYEGAVKCAYIDPPYNNLEKYKHYEDNDSHDAWLSSIVSCVSLLRSFLSHAGSLWISIDERQLHYLKVALDGVFGRRNFVTTIVWQQRTTRENRKVFSANHEYLLVYARDYSAFKNTRGSLPWTAEIAARYKNPDNDPRGPWQSISANAQAGHATASQFYELVAPGGRRHQPPKGRCWVYDKKRMDVEIAQGNIWFGRDGNGVPRVKRFLSDVGNRGITPHTLWLADEVGTNDSAKKHLLSLFPDRDVFDTPKPEGLIQRIFEIATQPGDLVLDAYLGSGTTAAVAQKMGRRYIGIEIGDHIISHCVSRLRKVIGGETGGISGAVGWQGGGDFKFLQLKRA